MTYTPKYLTRAGDPRPRCPWTQWEDDRETDGFEHLHLLVKQYVFLDWIWCGNNGEIRGRGIGTHYSWLRLLEAEAEVEAPRHLDGVFLNGSPITDYYPW